MTGRRGAIQTDVSQSKGHPAKPKARVTAKSQVSNEEMLRRLSSHPQIRNRISSLLAAVDDTAGDLKLANDAEHMLALRV